MAEFKKVKIPATIKIKMPSVIEWAEDQGLTVGQTAQSMMEQGEYMDFMTGTDKLFDKVFALHEDMSQEAEDAALDWLGNELMEIWKREFGL